MKCDCYDLDAETLPVKKQERQYVDRLNTLLDNVYANSDFYRAKLRKTGVRNIREVGELQDIPFTTKEEIIGLDFKKNICCPHDDLVEVHFSSGTTNKPAPSFFSKDDLKESNAALACTWYMQGVRKNSTFAMLASYGLFSAGLLNHYAIQHIGAFVLPISNIGTERSLELIQEYEADSMAAVASYYEYMITKMGELSIDPSNLSLKHVIAGGEPFSEERRETIEKKMDVTLFDQYGICEINTGLAGECEYREGLHLVPDYVYPEIIDPDTGERLPEGLEGELVLTTLKKQAFPLIRYRTGDITAIITDTCRCGRTTPRMGTIKKRVTRTYFYKGIKIETHAVEVFISEQSHLINPLTWKMILSGSVMDQHLTLQIIPKPGVDHDTVWVELEKGLHKLLNTKIQIELCESIKTGATGKRDHFMDERK